MLLLATFFCLGGAFDRLACVARAQASEPVPMPAPTASVILRNREGKELVRVEVSDGTVIFSQDYSPDAAADSFWTYVGLTSPVKLQKELSELDAANTKLQKENTRLVHRNRALDAANAKLQEEIKELIQRTHTLRMTIP